MQHLNLARSSWSRRHFAIQETPLKTWHDTRIMSGLARFDWPESVS
jgi:hypothetical protein